MKKETGATKKWRGGEENSNPEMGLFCELRVIKSPCVGVGVVAGQGNYGQCAKGSGS